MFSWRKNKYFVLFYLKFRTSVEINWKKKSVKTQMARKVLLSKKEERIKIDIGVILRGKESFFNEKNLEENEKKREKENSWRRFSVRNFFSARWIVKMSEEQIARFRTIVNNWLNRGATCSPNLEVYRRSINPNYRSNREENSSESMVELCEKFLQENKELFRL